jgi:hypothetical protein
MSQTVFAAGNPITSKLKLGVTPDGTTTATVVVRRPDGTLVSTTAPSGWVGDEKTVQWFATNDGTAGAATTLTAGDWLAVWTVTGTGASVSPKVYSVQPLPGTATRPDWSPFLSQVADHVPFLTVDTTTPGGQLYLGTFTGATTPTDEQAQRQVDNAAAVIAARVGVLPSTLYPLATAVTELRAAASILRAFARNRDDRDAADALDRRADASMNQLVDSAEAAGSATQTGPVPVGFFPDAPSYGDWNL